MAAQEAPDSATSLGLGAIFGFVEVSAGLTRLHGETSPLLGAAALLAFQGRWRAGGAGQVVARATPLPTTAGLPDIELLVGYGGLLVERWSRARSDDREGMVWATRLLLGAGNAEVRDVVTGVRLDSDNFLVVEPGVALAAPVLRRAIGQVIAGYRFTSAATGLERVDAEGLRGWRLGVAFRFGPF